MMMFGYEKMLVRKVGKEVLAAVTYVIVWTESSSCKAVFQFIDSIKCLPRAL